MATQTDNVDNSEIPAETTNPISRRAILVLLLAVSLISICAIIYEIIIAAVSSYLLGNSVYQFSITIGLFMSSMGLGSFLSKFFDRYLVNRFILIEIIIGVLGGVSSIILFNAYIIVESTVGYLAVMFTLIMAIGTLVGLEIPILTRIVAQYESLRVTLANVLAFDYVGALIGSIAFPLLLLKYTGLIQTAFIIGFVNVLVAGLVLLHYWSDIEKRARVVITVILAGGCLAVASAYGGRIGVWLESNLYHHRILFSKQSKYQKIVVTERNPRTEISSKQPNADSRQIKVTRRGGDVRLFIDMQLQFSSVDEFRYHEALVHPAMTLADSRESVLILGGGDGLAAREVLKYAEVQRILLVDIDPEITEVCSSHNAIVQLNGGSLSHPKVTIVNEDAYIFVERERANQTFDVVIIDLPDPNDEGLSKLYSVAFYKLVGDILGPGGTMVTQSTSPFFARRAFWCIHQSIEEAGWHAYAYHVEVPSMGNWGFNLASKTPCDVEDIRLRVETDFLTDNLVGAMFRFGKDVAEVETRLNKLLKPVLMFYYDDEKWRFY